MRPSLSLLLLLLSLSKLAHAADLENYDLASLCYLGQEVVLAEEVSHQSRVEPWNKTTTYKVTKVYQGTLTLGKEIEVYDDSYSLTIEAPYKQDATGAWKTGTAPTRESRVMLFLSLAPPWTITSEKPAITGVYRRAPSGMRIFADDKAYRFEQRSNPGPFEPVPQGIDPLNDRGLQRLTDTVNIEPISFAELEAELKVAMKRADAATKAIALTNPGARNTALLALLPAPRSFPATFRYDSFSRFEDRLSVILQEEIVKGGDQEAILEALGRDVDGSYSSFRPMGLFDKDFQARAEFFFTVANDEKRPTYQRDAALRTLGEAWDISERLTSSASFHPKTLCQDLSVLLSSPNRDVRVSASQVIGDSPLCLDIKGAKKQLSKLLTTAASKETDRLVLLSLGDMLTKLDAESSFFASLSNKDDKKLFFMPLAGPDAGITASALDLGVSYLVPHLNNGPLLSFTAKATAKDGKTYDASSNDMIWYQPGQEQGEGLVRLYFKAPLPSGSYQVEVTLHLDVGSKKSLERTGVLTIVVP